MPGQLTGYQRQISDIVADIYNSTKKWDRLNTSGSTSLSQLSNIKLKILSTTQQDHGNYNDELADITDKLRKTCLEMDKLSKDLTCWSHKLGLLKIAHEASLHPEDKGRIFDFFTFDQFIDYSQQIASMYDDEMKLKMKICSTAAHIDSYTNGEINNCRNILMTFTSSWINEPYLDKQTIEMHLESMLLETGHRKTA